MTSERTPPRRSPRDGEPASRPEVLGPRERPDGRHAAPANAPAVAQPAEPSLGQLVSDASTHLSTLVHSEIELAKLELRSTVKNAGTGVGMFAAAARRRSSSR